MGEEIHIHSTNESQDSKFIQLMFNKQIFSAFAILLAILFANESNAQNGDCVGVHITKWWDCASGTANAHAEPQGGTAPYIITWSNGDTGPNASGLTPGQYTVTVVDADSCLKAEVCIIVNPECCLWTNITTSPDGCQPGNNGQITIWEVGGGIAPYTILLPDGTTKTHYGNTPVFLNNFAAGVWYITITDAAGCSTDQMIEIEQESVPKVKLNANALTCNTATTMINTQVTGGPVTFLWNTGATTANLPNVGPGIYSVKVTNPSGCFDADTITITAPQQISLNATTTPTACGENNGIINVSTNASTVTVVAPNGSVFTLNGSATITGLQFGVYEITATNSNGCSMVETAIVDDSQPAKDSFECVTICQPSWINGTWVSSSVTLTDTLTNTSGCPFVFKTQVNFQMADTTHEIAHTCFGGVITVDNVSYKEDTVVYVQMNGVCSGLTIWTLDFSDAADSVSLPAVKICGGDSLATYTFTNSIGADCPELIVKRSFEHHPFTVEFSMTNTDTICGLAERSDSLFRNITVDNVNCIIKQPFGLLVTNLPTIDTIPGQTHFICGSPASTIWVETGDTTNLENCWREITGYWSVTTPQPLLYRDTINTCFPSVANQYPKFAEGVNCNPDTLTIAMLEEKPALAFVYQDTCYAGQLPMAPIQLLHPGNNCLGDTMIIVNPHYQVNTYGNETLCFGDTLYLDGVSITTEGDYSVFVGQTIHGCDSIKTVHVTMVFGSKFETNQDTCDLSVAGQKFWKTTTSPNGCVDSTEVTLTWLSGFKLDTTVVICAQRPDGLWHVSDTLQINGCWGTSDTTFILSPGYKTTFAKTCDPALDGKLKTKAWIPASVSGEPCDKWVYTYWKYEAPKKLTTSATICAGEVYDFFGPRTIAGTYTHLVLNQLGCNDTFELQLVVLPEMHTDSTIFVCPGGFWEAPDGAEVFADQSWSDFGESVMGCDSAHTVEVEEFVYNSNFGIPGDIVLTAPNDTSFNVSFWIEILTQGVEASFEIPLGATFIGDSLIQTSDSTWVQTFFFQTPCETRQMNRNIKLVKPVKPVTPAERICEIKIVHPGNGDWVFITVTPLPGNDFKNAVFTVYNSGGGREFFGSVDIGVEVAVSVASLKKGQIFFMGLTATINGNKDQVLHDLVDGELVPVVKKIVRL